MKYLARRPTLFLWVMVLAVFVARVGPDCDRCPVRTACPAHGAGRGVPDA
jgi:adenine-specific DNA glycosylase